MSLLRDKKGKFAKGNEGFWFGKKIPKEFVEKSRLKRIGLPSWNKGKKLSDEHRSNLSQAHMGISQNVGEKNGMWRGGVTPFRVKIYHSKEYQDWRKSVFERDDYTCQECGQRGRELNADHIKPFALYPDLRFDINNGRTLCVECHRKTPTWGVNARYNHAIK